MAAAATAAAKALDPTRPVTVVSFLGAAETPQKCVKALNHQYAPKLRHGLSGRIRMRVMPELRFIHDDSIERGMRMEQLLGGLAAEQRAQEEGGTDEES